MFIIMITEVNISLRGKNWSLTCVLYLFFNLKKLKIPIIMSKNLALYRKFCPTKIFLDIVENIVKHCETRITRKNSLQQNFQWTKLPKFRVGAENLSIIKFCQKKSISPSKSLKMIKMHHIRVFSSVFDRFWPFGGTSVRWYSYHSWTSDFHFFP